VSHAVLMPMPTHSKVKVRFVCPHEYKEYFAKSHCFLLISVGQPKHEGEKFKETIKKINANFKQCTIIPADSLQRFNFKIHKEELELVKLYEQAKTAGEEWLARNKDALNSLTIPYQINRWDDWLTHPEYQRKKAFIDHLYENNSDFHKAIFYTIKEFFLRQEKNYRNVNCFNAFKCCIEYLKEECAVLLLLAQNDFDFELYPGQRNLAMSLTYENFIKPNFPNKLKWVEIEFKNRKKIKAC